MRLLDSLSTSASQRGLWIFKSSKYLCEHPNAPRGFLVPQAPSVIFVLTVTLGPLSHPENLKRLLLVMAWTVKKLQYYCQTWAFITKSRNGRHRFLLLVNSQLLPSFLQVPLIVPLLPSFSSLHNSPLPSNGPSKLHRHPPLFLHVRISVHGLFLVRPIFLRTPTPFAP